MKKTPFLVMALFVFSLLGNATQVYGMEMTAEQKELWSQVQRGWELWKNGDKEGFKSRLHKDFKYFSFTSRYPKGKISHTGSLFYLELKSFELEPLGISISGNLALVMYNWTYTVNNGWSESGRSTAIYMKQDGKWQEMGGMNASCIRHIVCQ